MNARQALDVARPVFARMDATRGAESTTADLIEAWTAVENGLQSLLGNTAATGQALIRDARARQMLTFDQANSLIAFLSVREKLSNGYQPTDADVNTARGAFLKLDAGLGSDGAGAPPGPSASPYAPGGFTAPPPANASPPVSTVPAVGALSPLMVEHRVKRSPVWLVVGLIVLAVGFAVAAVMMWPKGKSDSLAQGVQAYQRGQREAAAIEFARAARDRPTDAMPHVYLARMAREVGNYTIANSELQLALKAQPASLDGRREYGSFFLAQGNYDQARIWYTHALEIDPADVASQGWLGCSLIKLNRIDEGMRWLTRAGNGQWAVCRSSAPSTAPPPIRP